MRQSGGAPFSFDHRQMGPYVELLLAARRVVVADREEFHKKVDLRTAMDRTRDVLHLLLLSKLHCKSD